MTSTSPSSNQATSFTQESENYRAWLDRVSAPGATAADILCDSHDPQRVAFTIIEPDLSSSDLTYGALKERSLRTAAALKKLGISQGDAVAVMMGKTADFLAVVLGIWRLGAVHVPLFTALAPQAIAVRMESSGAKLAIVDRVQRHKFEPSEDLPAERSWQIVRVDGADVAQNSHGVGWETDRVYRELVTDPELDPQGVTSAAVGLTGALSMLYTSGTTGKPKGVGVPLRAIPALCAYLENGLDVQPDDTYWNGADPGWAYGLYYALIAPMALGVRNLFTHAGFSPELFWHVFDRFGVTNFAGAPTMYRALRNSPDPSVKARLRRASSAGEPLTPEVVDWAEQALGTTVRDHYGQTEHGMVIGNAWRADLAAPAQAGSMGRPLPGWNCAILDQHTWQQTTNNTVGLLAIDHAASDLWWSLGYDQAEAATRSSFTEDGRWYITGDLAIRDDNGVYYFVSRDDDLILAAGYRIGPLDVETAMLRHPSVAEVAVVGQPDAIRGEIVVAFVVPTPGADSGDELTRELQQFVKTTYAAHAYPRAIYYIDSLPKTPSAKVQRFLLKSRAAKMAEEQE